ncbi:MAG: hypothetical protein ABJA83_11565 [Burkholderiaceae bacterium]
MLFSFEPALVANQWSEGLPFFGLMVAVCLVLNIAFGLPMYLVLRRFWGVGLKECLGAGVLIAVFFNLGAFLAVAIAFPDSHYSAGDYGGATYIGGKLTPHGWFQTAITLVYNMGLGASIGLCFWVIALWRNPQRVQWSVSRRR